VTPTKVSGVVETTDTITFHASRTGAPVLVKTSYFPDWQASGATGPFRVTPNLMVVVPTARTVTLTYGTATVGKIGDVLTVAGVVLLVLGFLATRRRRQRRPAHAASGHLG
jgi:LPXTG-motif cell wall-anchored protein